jgi:lysophospholipase L1-like esterase
MTTTARTFPCIALLAALLALAAGRPAAAADFPLKDGDLWVMAGDSITAQHLHSNYFEAFCYARYPKLTFRFRNSGVGGDTIPKVLARFDYDVAPWKPTVVSVELGMNDKGNFKTEEYVANMAKLSDRIQSVKALPVFLTASPINDGSTMAKLGDNARLDEYAVALKKFAAERKAPFADQFHALIDVWGKNKSREVIANALPALQTAAQDGSVAGAEHLKAFLEEQAKNGKPLVSMKGDAVHVGEPGQLMMAAALLKDLGADGFVSSLVVDVAAGKVVEAKACAVSDMKAEDGGLSFDRLDDSLTFPIPDEARPVVSLDPTILDLSRCGFKASGLKAERYKLSIDFTGVAVLTAKELEKGVNLTAYEKGGLAAQGKEVLAAVKAKEDLVNQWRVLSKTASAENAPADAKEKLADLTKKVEDADAKIREAAKPRQHRFELTPVK